MPFKYFQNKDFSILNFTQDREDLEILGITLHNEPGESPNPKIEEDDILVVETSQGLWEAIVQTISYSNDPPDSFTAKTKFFKQHA